MKATSFANVLWTKHLSCHEKSAYRRAMLQRPSSRLLVLNNQDQVLLFRFEPKSGPLSGRIFWATPGGGVEDNETYEETALRELHEELGITRDHPGQQVAQRTVVLTLYNGNVVEADERYFMIRINEPAISDANWSLLEREVMAAHHWWSQTELRSTTEQVWPADLEDILVGAGAWQATL
ncbi:ADP-ribose pyrophosphatase [Rhizobium leguminosarum bv. trifolii WSM2297]|uniref:ADP-ribose pyrophosphatase n=1 Tax=Rhizobium leguminosarum bv. trifolii WSM2297 TaxID=754762 RepID=J0CKP8_RHILT|nr:NUDIX domain-containing protein [Rhizobium leguminosarum]EJC84312.1 ADP-ribose pyrophosphatase [Rhizobium leguminosarum bv. trifolii WSM2297]